MWVIVVLLLTRKNSHVILLSIEIWEEKTVKGHEKPITLLKQSGYNAYFVGGCVRDHFMGRDVSDIDITTEATPNEIKAVFSDYRTLDIGIKHGTVTVMLNENSYEITTYRFDGGYVDHRHPTEVTFGVSLTEDLARRDFTINAIAWDGVSEPHDPFGGKADIENQTIRAVGDPLRRFEEDALRILRGLRFASVLGFTIDKATADAMREKKSLLHYVSAERVWQEFSKLLMGKKAACVITEYSDVLEIVIPELASMRGFAQRNPHHIYDVLTHTLVALDATPYDLVLRLAVLFHDCGKPSTFSTDEMGIGHFYGHAHRSMELTEKRLNALRVDTRTKKRVLRLIEHHDSPVESDNKQIVRRMRKLEEDYPLLVALRRADNRGQAEEYYRTELHDKALAMYEEILHQEKEASAHILAVNGNDLLKVGAKPGKNIGFLLSALADDILDEKVANERETILRFAKETYMDRFEEQNEKEE